jgi:predicted transcriptional regulator of viral defense system/very-short-patch-repair endonuclease
VDSVDALVSHVAESNHGVFAVHHLRELDINRHVRTHRLATGRWELVHEGVYRVVGAPLTWRGRLLAACWAGGTRAVASHRSAGELWELPGRNRNAIEITCPRWRRTQHDHLIVHESLAFDEVDTTVVDQIPVTTVARTLFDLAGVVGPTTLDIAVATALRRHLTTSRELEAILDRLARRGRAGTVKFRAVLALHQSTPAQTESEGEHLVMRLLAKHGLPAPVPQYEIRRADGTLLARVDFAYPDLKIAIEYDSYAHHLGTEAHDRDGARRNAVVGMKWWPITATAADLRNGGHRLANEVAHARATRSGVRGAE